MHYLRTWSLRGHGDQELVDVPQTSWIISGPKGHIKAKGNVESGM